MYTLLISIKCIYNMFNTTMNRTNLRKKAVLVFELSYTIVIRPRKFLFYFIYLEIIPGTPYKIYIWISRLQTIKYIILCSVVTKII